MNRAARRREQRGKVRATAAVGPEPIRISQVPRTENERRALRARCLKHAKFHGKRGRAALLAATRYYNDALAEAGRTIREPATQPSVLTRPGSAVPTPPAPRGMSQRESGLYVPQETQ